jgi:hypothetical protein
MPNCGCQPIVGDEDKVQNKRGPLVLDPINIQANSTHIEHLGITFLMPISVMLVVGPN